MNKIRCDKCQHEFKLKKRYIIFIFDTIESETYMTECPKCKNVVLTKIQQNQE